MIESVDIENIIWTGVIDAVEAAIPIIHDVDYDLVSQWNSHATRLSRLSGFHTGLYSLLTHNYWTETTI